MGGRGGAVCHVAMKKSPLLLSWPLSAGAGESHPTLSPGLPGNSEEEQACLSDLAVETG